MNQGQAVARLCEITKGIDQDECSSPDGWWETTTGAEFGAARLAELEALIRDLTDDRTGSPLKPAAFEIRSDGEGLSVIESADGYTYLPIPTNELAALSRAIGDHLSM